MSNRATHPFPVLLDRDTILRRIDELAREVEAAHSDFSTLLAVCVMEGARTFCQQLVQRMSSRPEVREVRASSYGDGTVSSGRVVLRGADTLEVEGRTVLLIEDIVDTGHTARRLADHLLARGARDVRIATLLSKPSRREVQVELHHVGFEIDDHFVIGFGMDVAGRYRELPEVAIYDAASAERVGTWS